VDSIRDLIEQTERDYEDARLRIIVKPQSKLWDEGVRASRTLGGSEVLAVDGDEVGDGEAETATVQRSTGSNPPVQLSAGAYSAAGTWGRYLRAPDFYFEVMREFGLALCPPGGNRRNPPGYNERLRRVLQCRETSPAKLWIAFATTAISGVST
jgi:hypothetical protein